MSSRTQIILVICIIVAAFTVTKYASNMLRASDASANISAVVSTDAGTVSPTDTRADAKKLPQRKMDVMDPEVDGESVLVQDLDLNFPYYNYQTYKQWPIASITKLMTAVIVTEDIGLTKKIAITNSVMDTEGIAGGLKSGEAYNAEDLAKIMLMVSSNRAANAFAEHLGGNATFTAMMNTKAQQLGMLQTTFVDASGLSPKNVSTTSDLLKLAKYIIEKHPEIIEWTRLQTIKVQPTNATEIREITNIDPFSARTNFLGGKTGTTPEARENLLALFTFQNDRIIYILLGSHDRVTTTDKLFAWMKNAFTFN